MDLVSQNSPLQVSVMYWVSAAVLIALLIEASQRLSQLRWVFAGLIYLTTGLWYFVDPAYMPEHYEEFTGGQIDNGYFQVLIFMVAFRIFMESLAPPTRTGLLRHFDPRQLDRGDIVRKLVLAWMLLWTIGIVHADFHIVESMFPYKSRSDWSPPLFARGRFGGTTGFLLSAGGYTYMVICSAFGLVLVSTSRRSTRFLMLSLIAFTWPMFFMSGSRHKALAVALPAIFATLLMKNWTRRQQIAFLGVCAVLMNLVMLIVIEFRNDGFDKLLVDDDAVERVAEARHLGLNMSEELLHILRYQQDGKLDIEWGYNYWGHLVSGIPRALWPDKPFVGKELAELRVGTNLSGDVNATISFGFIGQGVANFGEVLGPLAPALLLALYGRWLCWYPTRGNRYVRVCFVIFCLALIPNLGRDISLFVLWPVVFAYAGVVFYERQAGSRTFAPPVPVRRRHPMRQH